MGARFDRLADRLLHRGALRRWTRAADAAARVDLATLRLLRTRARVLRRQLDRLLFVAENRLALPLIGSSAMRRPMGTDWAWRPDYWRGPAPVPGIASVPPRAELGPGATLFHDAPDSEITARQLRNTRESDLAPYGLRLDLFHFGGSFLSLALDLPDEAVQGLRLRHLIRLETVLELERPMPLYARLNIRQGPNTEQVALSLVQDGDEAVAEFDLAYTRMVETRVEKLWIDLIFEQPQMNRITLRDVTLSRRPRAEL